MSLKKCLVYARVLYNGTFVMPPKSARYYLEWPNAAKRIAQISNDKKRPYLEAIYSILRSPATSSAACVQWAKQFFYKVFHVNVIIANQQLKAVDAKFKRVPIDMKTTDKVLSSIIKATIIFLAQLRSKIFGKQYTEEELSTEWNTVDFSTESTISTEYKKATTFSELPNMFTDEELDSLALPQDYSFHVVPADLSTEDDLIVNVILHLSLCRMVSSGTISNANLTMIKSRLESEAIKDWKNKALSFNKNEQDPRYGHRIINYI